MLLSRYLKAIWKKKCMVGLLKKVKEIVSSSAFSSLVFAYNWIEHRGRNFRCVPFQQMLYWLLVLTGHFLLFTAFDSLDPLLIKKHIWGIWNPATRFPSPIFFVHASPSRGMTNCLDPSEVMACIPSSPYSGKAPWLSPTRCLLCPLDLHHILSIAVVLGAMQPTRNRLMIHFMYPDPNFEKCCSIYSVSLTMTSY